MIRAGACPDASGHASAERDCGRARTTGECSPHHDPMWRLDVGDQRHSGFFADDGSASRGGKREGDVRAGPRHPQHFPAADGVPGEQGVAERRAVIGASPTSTQPAPGVPAGAATNRWSTHCMASATIAARSASWDRGRDRSTSCSARMSGASVRIELASRSGSTRFSPGERPLILKVASRMATSART